MLNCNSRLMFGKCFLFINLFQQNKNRHITFDTIDMMEKYY